MTKQVDKHTYIDRLEIFPEDCVVDMACRVYETKLVEIASIYQNPHPSYTFYYDINDKRLEPTSISNFLIDDMPRKEKQKTTTIAL